MPIVITVSGYPLGLLFGGFWSVSFPPPGVICTSSSRNVLISSVRWDIEELFISNNFLRSYFGRLVGWGVGVKNSLDLNFRALCSNHYERVTCIMFGAIIPGVHYLARSDYRGSVLFTFWSLRMCTCFIVFDSFLEFVLDELVIMKCICLAERP